MEKKRILVISQYYYPENFRINDMCEEWVNRGYDVTVITGIPNYPEGKFYKGYGFFKKRKEVINGVKVYRKFITPRGSNKISLMLNYMSFVISGWFWKLFTRIKSDVVFTFEVSPMTQALLGVWYSKRKKVPSILYVQDLWPENLEIVGGVTNKFILKRITNMTMKIYKKTTKILTTSKSFKNSIINRGISESKIDFWPQYAEDFYKRKSIYKRKDKDNLKIIFTGNIGEAQGLDILPVVAKKLRENKFGDRVKFIIIGNGRNKDNLIKQINDNEVAYMFDFIEAVPATKILGYLEQADVAFVSFVDNDLFKMTIPAKLQSYIAAGMPILGVVSGETEDIINEGNFGLVSSPGDYEQTYKNILKFLNMDNLELQNYSNNAQKYFKDNYNKKSLMDKFDELLIKVGKENV